MAFGVSVGATGADTGIEVSVAKLVCNDLLLDDLAALVPPTVPATLFEADATRNLLNPIKLR